MRTSSIIVAAFVALTVSAGMALSQPAAPTQPAGEPASAASAPVDPAAVKILDGLEQAGVKYATVEANIAYTVLQTQIGTSETRVGSVIFQRKADKQPVRFYIRFDSVKQEDEPPVLGEEQYVFDGMWLTIVKHRIKTMQKIQVVAEGHEYDPLKLDSKGLGFPLPFGQKTADVLRCFDVSTRAPRKGDPADADYVKLVTRKECREDMNFQTLDMWVDRTTHLPVKLVSDNKNKDISTVVFSDLKPDANVDPKLFVVEPKVGEGWQLSVEPLNKPGDKK